MNIEIIIKSLSVVMIICSISSLIPVLYSMLKGYKLYSYLKKNNYDRLQEFGSSIDNFKVLRYINSDKDNNDEQIAKIKYTMKQSVNAFAILALSAFSSGALAVILAYSFSKK